MRTVAVLWLLHILGSIAFTVAMLCATGCKETDPQVKAARTEATVEGFEYFYDTHTNLCFMSPYSVSYGVVLVPCTEKVLAACPNYPGAK